MSNTKRFFFSEENYFFKLTKYKDQILKHIKQNPDFIIPSFRANEVINQLENIEDISTYQNVSIEYEELKNLSFKRFVR